MAEPRIDRLEQTFPTLTPAQIARISALGHRRPITAGEVLIEEGDQNSAFYVVVTGAIDVVRPTNGHEERVIVHRTGGFTGEINMLSSRRSLVRSRVLEDGEVIVVERDHLRT